MTSSDGIPQVRGPFPCQDPPKLQVPFSRCFFTLEVLCELKTVISGNKVVMGCQEIGLDNSKKARKHEVATELS